jgi:hypothetical protein
MSIQRFTAEPGSRLAQLRIRGHRLIDARIEFGDESRNDVYVWLAREMGIPIAWCHFGCFDETHCELAISKLERA